MPAAIPLAAAMFTVSAGATAMAAATTLGASILAGVTIAGGVLSGVGAVTGNQRLTRLGALAGLAGAAGGKLLETAGTKAATDAAGAAASEAANATTGATVADAAGTAGDVANVADVTGTATSVAQEAAKASPLADIAAAEPGLLGGGIIGSEAGGAIAGAAPAGQLAGGVSSAPMTATRFDLANGLYGSAGATSPAAGAAAGTSWLDTAGDKLKGAASWMKQNPELTKVGAGLIQGGMQYMGQQQIEEDRMKREMQFKDWARQRYSDSVRNLRVPSFAPPVPSGGIIGGARG